MISIIISGDFAPLLNPGQVRDDHFNSLNDILSSACLHVTNLECPVSEASGAIRKTGPVIKAYPEAIKLLKQAKVSVACLANNHIFDFGERGILDTLDTCRRNNIETIGITSRPDRENHWIIKEVEGKRIGLLNYCEHEFSVRDKGLIGARGYDPVDAYMDISELKKTVDFVIVIYHGGNEYYNLPNPDLKKDFHFLADIGADAVIGHHTHVYSGYEVYQGKLLIYSIGNFFFPSPAEPPGWYNGIIVKLTLDRKTGFQLIPVKQGADDFSVTLVEDEEKERAIHEIDLLSGIVKNDYELREHWNEYVDKNGRGLSDFVLISGRLQRFLFKTKILRKLSGNKRSLAIANIIRCRSLRLIVEKKLSDKL
jgi:poly-gamma-glutamate synthesis protein (capsule biosynthesis protein)